MLNDFQQSGGMPSIIIIIGCESGSDWQSKFTAGGSKLVVSSGGSGDAAVASAAIEKLINGLADGKTVEESISIANEGINRHNQQVVDPMTPLFPVFGEGFSGQNTIGEILP